jgi:hypothetical protein
VKGSVVTDLGQLAADVDEQAREERGLGDGRDGEPPEASGAGETAITVVAAAVGNAIFDATGARIREVPFTPDRVRQAVASRAI